MINWQLSKQGIRWPVSPDRTSCIERFLRLHTVTKPLNKKINIINYLLCWSVTLLMSLKHSTTACSTNFALVRSEKRLARAVILEISWTVSSKAHDWSSWILTECNLSWKIVKYFILSGVCMINSTVAPQTWCIKSGYKNLICTPRDLLARFCKVIWSNTKNLAWFVFLRICFPGLIYCDQEALWL